MAWGIARLPTPTSQLRTIMYFSPWDVTSTKRGNTPNQVYWHRLLLFSLIVSPDNMILFLQSLRGKKSQKFDWLNGVRNWFRIWDKSKLNSAFRMVWNTFEFWGRLRRNYTCFNHGRNWACTRRESLLYDAIQVWCTSKIQTSYRFRWPNLPNTV